MTGDLPRISIVTPSFNHGQFLAETIESVLDQRYPNLEYMVLDGGSTDGSRSIIERYARHLSYWRSHPDAGQAAALSEGFERATGEIFAWLNSDDWYEPGALHAVAKTWERASDVLVTGGVRWIGSRTRRKPHFPAFQGEFDQPVPLPVPAIFDLSDGWARGDFLSQPGVFFPNDLYREVGGVDPRLHYTMDIDLWVKFALVGARCVVLRDVLAAFRVHGEQKTASRKKAASEAQETMERHIRNAADVPGDVRERILRANAGLLSASAEVKRLMRAIGRLFV